MLVCCMSGDRQLPVCLSTILAVSQCFLQGKGAGVIGAFIEYFTPLQTLSNTTYMSAPDHVPARNTTLELVTGKGPFTYYVSSYNNEG